MSDSRDEDSGLDDLESFHDLSLLDRIKEVHLDLVRASPPRRLLALLDEARKLASKK